jgi:hypothetical protein
MKLFVTDGGRSAAGFKGETGDCVTRAIAIATGKPYQEVYAALFVGSRKYAAEHHDKTARGIGKSGATPRNGVHRKIYQAYLESLGWQWVSCMGIGTGTTIHLKANELPAGRIIARLSGHLCAVIEGVIHDAFDPSRHEQRCVYGYFKESA